ncbi:hypothetical protein IM25_03555 [Rhodococcus sp. p52]|nr:hypothetical protein [Rhodococcus sp. p52]AOD20823.1 hypothetical protein IM25_03555 [Rhodococcus sp. p52]
MPRTDRSHSGPAGAVAGRPRSIRSRQRFLGEAENLPQRDTVVVLPPHDRDCAFYRRWTAISKDPQQLRTWLKEWVLTTADHAEYLEKLGEEYWADLEVAPRPSGTVDYGSRK